jgi:hypothetical protein
VREQIPGLGKAMRVHPLGGQKVQYGRPYCIVIVDDKNDWRHAALLAQGADDPWRPPVRLMQR